MCIKFEMRIFVDVRCLRLISIVYALAKLVLP